MTNLSDLYEFLEYKMPKALSEDWDNDGIMIMEKECKVSKILICLDVTENIANYAIKEKFNLIISHHPLIFHPLKSVCDKRIINLIKNNISVFSFHTRLDAVDGGVNDTLCEKLGLSNIEKFGNLVRIGEYNRSMSVGEFADILKTTLGTDKLSTILKTNEVRKVCVLGGAGKDEYSLALESGADTYLTGEMSYSTMTDANNGTINVFEAGHFETEFPVCNTVKKWINEFNPNIECEIIKDKPIKTL